MKQNDGGIMFPIPMTMRQWYKGMALRGFLAQGLQRHELGEGATFAWYLSRACYMADALIAEDAEFAACKEPK